MTINRGTLLFFDASCLIAAAGSSSGGSGFLLSLCERGLLRGAVSQPVLLEAERNVREKMGFDALERYRSLIVLTPLVLSPLPPRRVVSRHEGLVGQKDAHVLAAALAAQASFLLTLDRRLAERVNQANLGIRALSPGDFIKTELPRHGDYPSARR
jgi:predicted nucleic acid-binding protein